MCLFLRGSTEVMKFLIITFTLAALTLFVSLKYASSQDDGDSGQKKNRSANWYGTLFRNQVVTSVGSPGTFASTIWLYMTGREERRPRKRIEFRPVMAGGVQSRCSSDLRVTWLGHSTVLIEIDGRRYLTDPIWSKRCSPVPGAGPARFFDVPLALEDVPRLDGVIISHDHYDHLDEATIRKLAGRDVFFYVPLGVGRYLKKWGVPADRVREFDWRDEADLGGGHRLIAAPARHFSGRLGPIRKDNTLWASWIIVGPRHRVYFGGDSGYHAGFKRIGDEFGPFDVTMLEIGAYHPNWGDIHMGPENALRAHGDLRGRALLPIHWGTFQLALHGWTEPVEQVRAGAKEKGIRLLLPEPGQPVDDPGAAVDSGWWTK